MVCQSNMTPSKWVENWTKTENPFNLNTFIIISMKLFMIPAIFLGLAGNLAVLYVIVKISFPAFFCSQNTIKSQQKISKSSLQNRQSNISKILLASLAISDLLYVVVVIPIQVFIYNSEIIPKWACFMNSFVEKFLGAFSSYALILLAVQRLQCVLNKQILTDFSVKFWVSFGLVSAWCLAYPDYSSTEYRRILVLDTFVDEKNDETFCRSIDQKLKFEICKNLTQQIGADSFDSINSYMDHHGFDDDGHWNKDIYMIGDVQSSCARNDMKNICVFGVCRDNWMFVYDVVYLLASYRVVFKNVRFRELKLPRLKIAYFWNFGIFWPFQHFTPLQWGAS